MNGKLACILDERAPAKARDHRSSVLRVAESFPASPIAAMLAADSDVGPRQRAPGVTSRAFRTTIKARVEMPKSTFV
jgi:hypothetical protein